MKARFRVPLYVVAVALLGLIGLLATLQYRWLGRISEAERDRMRAALETGASGFAQDFDAELTRGYLLFQTDPLSDLDDGPARFADPLRPLARDVEVPADDRGVLCVPPGGSVSRWCEFDPPTRTFTPVEWPAAMRDWRTHLTDANAEQSSPSRDGSTFFIRHMASPIWESAPAIVVHRRCWSPATADRSRAAGCPRLTYTILLLDRDYITRDMLPALVDQHFTGISGTEFQVAVVSREPGGTLLYHSSESFNPAPGAHVDATADLFSVRTQDFSRVASEVHRFSAYAATVRLRTARGDAAPGADRKQPVSIIVERVVYAASAGGVRRRQRACRWTAAADPRHGHASELAAPAGRTNPARSRRR